MADQIKPSSSSRRVPTLRKRAARRCLRDDPPPYTAVATGDDIPLDLLPPQAHDNHEWSLLESSPSPEPEEEPVMPITTTPPMTTIMPPPSSPQVQVQHIAVEPEPSLPPTSPSLTSSSSGAAILPPHTTRTHNVRVEPWAEAPATPLIAARRAPQHPPHMQNALSLLLSIALATLATVACSLTGLFLAFRRVRTLYPFSSLTVATIVPLTVLGALAMSTACIYPLVHYEAHKARSSRPHSPAGLWLVRGVYIMGLSVLPFAVGVALLPGAVPPEVTTAHAVQLCVWGFARLVLLVLNASAVFVCGWACGVKAYYANPQAPTK